MIKTSTCIICHAAFAYTTRPTRYCKACRIARDIESKRERRRKVSDDQHMLHTIAEGMRDFLEPSMYAQIEDYIESLGVHVTRVALVPDRMPAGANTPAGPDEGHSTNYADLAGQLHAKRMGVIMHDWFRENPHWAVTDNATQDSHR